MRLAAKLAAAAALACVPATAQAAVVITIQEVSTNVVVTLSGSIDLTGLTIDPDYSLSVAIRGTTAYVGLGTQGNMVDGWTGFSGPTVLGPGTGIVFTGTSVSSNFALNSNTTFGTYIFLPTGYVSGSALAGTALFSGRSFASLGLTPGQYVYTSSADTVTINIGAAVPEPGSWAMMIGGFGLIGAGLRRRRAVRTSVRYA